jgi:hypothetical protein
MHEGRNCNTCAASRASEHVLLNCDTSVSAQVRKLSHQRLLCSVSVAVSTFAVQGVQVKKTCDCNKDHERSSATPAHAVQQVYSTPCCSSLSRAGDGKWLQVAKELFVHVANMRVAFKWCVCLLRTSCNFHPPCASVAAPAETHLQPDSLSCVA